MAVILEKTSEALEFAVLTGTEIYQLSGAERKKFLNAYNTQNVSAMGENSQGPGVFLTQKGKIVSDALILTLPDNILLLFPAGFGARVKSHLETFLMFSPVELEDRSSQWSHLALFGPNAASWLKDHVQGFAEAETDRIQTVEFSGGKFLTFPSRRFGTEAWEILIPKTSAADLIKQLSSEARTVEADALERLRVEAGLPKMGVDMGEENLVAEVGLDKTATSFNKGCYLGQETTARVDSRGHVNRKLFRVKLDAAPPASLPAELFQGEKKVGALTSAVQSSKFGGWIGLALLSLQAAEKSEAIYCNAEPGKIEVKLL